LRLLLTSGNGDIEPPMPLKTDGRIANKIPIPCPPLWQGEGSNKTGRS
jgi:hypothetical protein